MVELRLLNAMTPPKYVRELPTFAFQTCSNSIPISLKNTAWRGANNELQGATSH
jgi:hypothetical protein